MLYIQLTVCAPGDRVRRNLINELRAMRNTLRISFVFILTLPNGKIKKDYDRMKIQINIHVRSEPSLFLFSAFTYKGSLDLEENRNRWDIICIGPRRSQYQQLAVLQNFKAR